MKNATNCMEVSSSLEFEKIVANICIWVIYTVVCQLLNVFGIVTNIINMSCFVKQGFQDATTIGLFGLSISDLCSLITMAWICVTLTPAFLAADISFNSLEVTYLVSAIPHFAFTRVSSCITAMITIERCLSVTAPLKVKQIITPRRSGAIVICIFLIFTFSATPLYVVNWLETRFSPLRNRSVIVVVSTKDREQVERIVFTINSLIVPMGAFIIIAISTVILALQLNIKIKWRSTTIHDAQAERISNRNKQVAKMVVTISTLFIACYTPIIIVTMAVVFIPDLYLGGKNVHISMTISGFIYTLESLNSSMNIFIYHNMSTKYKDVFGKLFGGKPI